MDELPMLNSSCQQQGPACRLMPRCVRGSTVVLRKVTFRMSPLDSVPSFRPVPQDLAVQSTIVTFSRGRLAAVICQ